MGNRIFFEGKKNVEKYREGPDPEGDRDGQKFQAKPIEIAGHKGDRAVNNGAAQFVVQVPLTQLYEFQPILPQKTRCSDITYKKREAHVVQVPALVVTSEGRAAAYPGDS